MRRAILILAAGLPAFNGVGFAYGKDALQPDLPTFKGMVAPLVSKHCTACHGAKKQKGDVRLDTVDGDLVKGKSISLWKDVLHRIETGEMPPDPGCLTPTDLAESPNPQCSDGLDIDGDGTVDYPEDEACAHGVSSEIEGLRGRNEASPAQCSDGIDNDGDGFTDYQPEFHTNGNNNPNFENGDPDCSDAFDNGEDS